MTTQELNNQRRLMTCCLPSLDVAVCNAGAVHPVERHRQLLEDDAGGCLRQAAALWWQETLT